MQNQTTQKGLSSDFLKKRHRATPYEQLLDASCGLNDKTAVVHLTTGSVLVKGIESLIDPETGNEVPAEQTVGLYQLDVEPQHEEGGTLESFLAKHGKLLCAAGPVSDAGDWLNIIPVLFRVELEENMEVAI